MKTLLIFCLAFASSAALADISCNSTFPIGEGDMSYRAYLNLTVTGEEISYIYSIGGLTIDSAVTKLPSSQAFEMFVTDEECPQHLKVPKRFLQLGRFKATLNNTCYDSPVALDCSVL